MRFLIVSGPTREPLDPVRYISNYSTGVMGCYLVQAAKSRGHQVDWVECPSSAETARDLLKELKRRLPKSDVLIMAAAVCDARPISFSPVKIKKEKLTSIKLVKNPDILAELSKQKKKNQLFIGFALESGDLLKNGIKKLRRKSLELIVIQQVKKNKTPFGEKPVDVYLLDACGCMVPFKAISKKKLAKIIVQEAENRVTQEKLFVKLKGFGSTKRSLPARWPSS